MGFPAEPVPEEQNSGKMVTPLSSSTNSINDTGLSSEANASDADESKDKGKEANPDQPHHPIAEFLYQLTKMLQDNNEEIIEWSQARIKVHHPDRLETEVLHKYFRHSKFASFQRQLNYFGFRKIAGKGKMAPCSYVNESCTSDIKSLLQIKRKTNGSAARKAAMNRAMQAEKLHQAGALASLGGIPPHLQELMTRALAAGYNPAANQALANAGLLPQLQQPPVDQTQQAFAALAAGQKRQSASDFARFSMNPAFGALGQFNQQQQLNQINQQQQQLTQLAGALQGLAPAPSNMSAPASLLAAAAAASQGAAPAAASMPATAAMNAALASGKNNSQLFEATPNLQSLVKEQSGQAKKAMAAGNFAANRAANQGLMNRLPSSGTIFPDSLSSVSLSQMINGGLSSNRLNSMVSLNNYLSREPSLVDLLLANGANAGQLAAAGMVAQPPAGGGNGQA